MAVHRSRAAFDGCAGGDESRGAGVDRLAARLRGRGRARRAAALPAGGQCMHAAQHHAPQDGYQLIYPRADASQYDHLLSNAPEIFASTAASKARPPLHHACITQTPMTNTPMTHCRRDWSRHWRCGPGLTPTASRPPPRSAPVRAQIYVISRRIIGSLTSTDASTYRQCAAPAPKRAHCSASPRDCAIGGDAPAGRQEVGRCALYWRHNAQHGHVTEAIAAHPAPVLVVRYVDFTCNCAMTRNSGSPVCGGGAAGVGVLVRMRVPSMSDIWQ